MVKVAIITTSWEDLGGTGKKTGLWYEELAAPFFYFTDKGYDVVVASIKGGNPPIDAGSLSGDFVKPECCQKALKDEAFNAALMSTIPVADLKSSELDAVYLVGGHGCCWDFVGTAALNDLVSSVASETSKVVGATCHGVFGLFEATSSGGEPLVKGKKVTGFSNTEEAAVQLTDAVPYTPEDKLRELGGVYEKGGDWGPFAVVDGRLVTGQNPASSTLVAEKMAELF